MAPAPLQRPARRHRAAAGRRPVHDHDDRGAGPPALPGGSSSGAPHAHARRPGAGSDDASGSGATRDTARYILPPGNYGGLPTTANSLDQLPLYDALTPLRGHVTAGDINRYFLPENFTPIGTGHEEVTGRPAGYRDQTVEEAWATRRPSGHPDWEVEGWVSSYLAIRDGELATVSDVVPQVAGHPALTVADHLRRHPEDWAHLR